MTGLHDWIVHLLAVSDNVSLCCFLSEIQIRDSSIIHPHFHFTSVKIP